jgi:DNA-binding beta-propeller fold protein YncE
MHRNLFIISIVFGIVSLACGSATQLPPTNLLATDVITPRVSTINKVTETVQAIPLSSEDKPINPKIQKLWAFEVFTDIEFADMEYFTGGPSDIACGNEPYPWFFSIENPKESYTLDFHYPYPLIPLEINIYLTHPTDDVFTISVGNDANQFDTQVYSGKIPYKGSCPYVFTIPVNISDTVDQIALQFTDVGNPVQITSIELVGILPHYLDISPVWRVEIPADYLGDADSQFPGGIAIDELNNIYIANGQNGLIKMDKDGQVISTYLNQNPSNYSDVALDQFQNIVVSDLLSKEFVVLSKNGTRNISGGMDFSPYSPRAVAVSPFNGYVYVLDVGDVVNRVQVYTGNTGEYLHEIPLEQAEYPSYKGLAFDSDGYLYTLDVRRGSILKMDVNNQSIVEELAHQELQNAGTADLAIDKSGNIYILLHNSPENSAIYVLDSKGGLFKRFGNLNYDGSDHDPGAFMFPVSLAVSDDGNMVAVCENGFITAYQFD